MSWENVIKRSSGTATIAAADNTSSVTVYHSLGVVPNRIHIFSTNEAALGFFLTSVTASSFIINLQVPPGSDATFSYDVERD